MRHKALAGSTLAFLVEVFLLFRPFPPGMIPASFGGEGEVSLLFRPFPPGMIPASFGGEGVKWHT